MERESKSGRPAGDWQDQRRDSMIRTIVEETRDSERYTGIGALAPSILTAMSKVPRHEFVPAGEREIAYVNNALPIGHGQTISQPFIVALMTHLLRPEPRHVILEIGTGSGYQAAILSLLARQVYSIEVIPELAAAAAERLQLLGYRNVQVRTGDGNRGWPEHGPYDGIVVTAAASSIPTALTEQLKPGGRLVIPIGDYERYQELTVLAKSADGALNQQSILPVAFVPLVSGEESSETLGQPRLH